MKVRAGSRSTVFKKLPASLFFLHSSINKIRKWRRNVRRRIVQHRIGRTESAVPKRPSPEPHTSVHIFFFPWHSTSLTERNLWEYPNLSSEFLFGLPFFDLPLHPPPSPEHPPSNRQESWKQSISSYSYFQFSIYIIRCVIQRNSFYKLFIILSLFLAGLFKR